MQTAGGTDMKIRDTAVPYMALLAPMPCMHGAGSLCHGRSGRASLRGCHKRPPRRCWAPMYCEIAVRALQECAKFIAGEFNMSIARTITFDIKSLKCIEFLSEIYKGVI